MNQTNIKYDGKKARYMCPPDIPVINTKHLKKIGSRIVTDRGCKMRLDDYEDTDNVIIIRKVTVLSVSIIN